MKLRRLSACHCRRRFSLLFGPESGVDKGFSLIELVVVVAVLAILAAVAIPNYLSAQKDAKISVTLNLLATIVKECAVRQVRGDSNPTFDEIATGRSRENKNTYGDAYGGYGFTYDTSLASATPITATDSCFELAAKSDTLPGSTDPVLPHFMISFNPATGEVLKDCLIGSKGVTYENGTCDENADAGRQW